MENNSVTRSSTNTSTSPTMTDTPSKAQGRAVVTAFMFESAIIVIGNMLVIILFAQEKKICKKSLFLVMNMALTDVMLGAVFLPLYVIGWELCICCGLQRQMPPWFILLIFLILPSRSPR